VNAKSSAQSENHPDLVSILAESILAKRTARGTAGFVVGIDGKGCSGKSQLSHSLISKLQQLGTECIGACIDDFCTPLATRYGSDFPEGLQVYHCNFDEQTWIEGVIRPYHAIGRVSFDQILLDPRFDSYTNRVQLELAPGGILVAEGLHLRKRAYRDLFDYSILLHVSDEIQLGRALIRDSRERGKTEEEVRSMYSRRYAPSFQHYLREDRPCDSVDVVIDYGNPESPVILGAAEAAEIA